MQFAVTEGSWRRRSLDYLFRDRPHGKRPARVVKALKCPTRAINSELLEARVKYGGGAGFADRLDRNPRMQGMLSSAASLGVESSCETFHALIDNKDPVAIAHVR